MLLDYKDCSFGYSNATNISILPLLWLLLGCVAPFVIVMLVYHRSLKLKKAYEAQHLIYKRMKVII